MPAWFDIIGDQHTVALFGVKLVGVNAVTGLKVLLSLAFILILLALRYVIQRVCRHFGRHQRTLFWFRQTSRLALAGILLLGLLSIWFSDPTRLATMFGLITAGLAFALQRAVTALAGYMVILRGKTFHVGDRIVMGGVRGDVIALGFFQTTIMEMGQPPPTQSDPPALWVQARQYTGRIVTITNAKVFDEPVYNYTREFPYVWEEIRLPIAYAADRERAEGVLLAAARNHAEPVAGIPAAALVAMERRYQVQSTAIEPRVFYRLTDNWLELSVRFLVADHGIREVKDRMSRDILVALDAAGIAIASATIEIVGIPPVRIASGAA